MSEPRTAQYRIVSTLSVGSKICVILGAVLLIGAAYFYWVPLTIASSTGPLFKCQSAANPPAAAFSKSVCGDINRINEFRALALLVAALVVIGGGLALFGSQRRTEVGVGPMRDRDRTVEAESDYVDQERADGSARMARSPRRRDDERATTGRRLDHDDDGYDD